MQNWNNDLSIRNMFEPEAMNTATCSRLFLGIIIMKVWMINYLKYNLSLLNFLTQFNSMFSRVFTERLSINLFESVRFFVWMIKPTIHTSWNLFLKRFNFKVNQSGLEMPESHNSNVTILRNLCFYQLKMSCRKIKQETTVSFL